MNGVFFFTTVGCRSSSLIMTSDNDDGENLSKEKLTQKKTSVQQDQGNSPEILEVPSFPASSCLKTWQKFDEFSKVCRWCY